MYNAGLKGGMTQVSAASHLLCKRAFGVSELRSDKNGELCCEYSRNIDPCGMKCTN